MVAPVWIDSASRLCCTSFSNSRRTLVRVHLSALILLLPLTAVAQTQSSPPKPEIVQYHATIDTVKYVFGVAPPVARLKPGNSFTLVKGDNPLTGPFYIEGAQPGDTLVIHILDLQVDGKQGVGTFS